MTGVTTEKPIPMPKAQISLQELFFPHTDRACAEGSDEYRVEFHRLTAEFSSRTGLVYEDSAKYLLAWGETMAKAIARGEVAEIPNIGTLWLDEKFVWMTVEQSRNEIPCIRRVAKVVFNASRKLEDLFLDVV